MPIGVTSIGYDPLGHPTSYSNDDSSILLTYDSLGELASTTTSGTSSSPQPTVTLSYAYDAVGNQLSITGPEGRTAYGYDSLNRITSVTDPSAAPFTFGYDLLSRLTSLSRPDGVNDALTYDSAGRLLSRQASLGSNQLARAAYAYDGASRRTGLSDSTGSSSFNYDQLGQLIAATHPNSGPPAENYTYDQIGNRTSWVGSPQTSTTYDAADRLTSDGSFTYVYDAEGNMLSKTSRTTGQTTTFDWSGVHELRAVHSPDGTTASYRYDPLGRRIEVNSAGQITRYVYDRDNIHLEYDGNNNLAASYVTGLAADKPLEMVRGGQAYYYLLDGLGSTIGLVDSSGKIAVSYSYDGFGRLFTTSTLANPYTFTGRPYDAKSGLYYDRGRYFDPQIGRFLSPDTVTSINPYPYADNAPTNLVDPSGHVTIIEYAFIKARALVVGVVPLSVLGRNLVRIFNLLNKIARNHRTLSFADLFNEETGESEQVASMSGNNWSAVTRDAVTQAGYKIVPAAGKHAEEAIADYANETRQSVQQIGTIGPRPICGACRGLLEDNNPNLEFPGPQQAPPP